MALGPEFEMNWAIECLSNGIEPHEITARRECSDRVWDAEEALAGTLADLADRAASALGGNEPESFLDAEAAYKAERGALDRELGRVRALLGRA